MSAAFETWSTCVCPATLSRRRPFFSDQQSGFARREIQGVADVAPRQINAIDTFGEFLRETHPH